MGLARIVAPPCTLSCHVTEWAAWAPGLIDKEAWHTWEGSHLPPDDGSEPEIRFVDALLRRRLGRLSRMALHVAGQAVGEIGSATTIFASRHGELSRTVRLLHDLASFEAPSPAAFSLSVHNTAAGVFSIARSDSALSTALAAGEETFLWALQDATLRLAADPVRPVLLVYADEALPNEYRAIAAPTETAFTLALLMNAGSDLQLTWHENIDSAGSKVSLPLTFFAWLLGRGDTLSWHGERLSLQGYRNA